MPQATLPNTTVRTAPKPHEAVAAVVALFVVPPVSALPALKTCPFCLADPESKMNFLNKAVIYCNNDDCPAGPEVSGYTMAEAAKRWNHRFHPGYVAPEVSQ